MSHRSFGLVDHKVAEADFFLEKMLNSNWNLFEFQCYLGAFVSAARGITFSLQSALHDLNGFEEWYSIKRSELQKDPSAIFFRNFRNIIQHVGNSYGFSAYHDENHQVRHRLIATPDIPEVPSEDIESLCKKYYLLLISLVFDCYQKFGPYINAHQRYTKEFFDSVGKTVEDAEEELGFPRGWTSAVNLNIRFKLLREYEIGCEINHLFQKHLGKAI